VIDKRNLSQKEKYLIRADGAIDPLTVTKASGAILNDANGKEYIDCFSGGYVMNTGHSHPKVVEAVKRQIEMVAQISLLHSTIPALDLAEKISQIMPGNLDKVFFTVAGAEAVEYAIRMARMYLEKHEILALRYGYHGMGFGAAAATSMYKYKVGMGPIITGVHHAMSPYCYRCPFHLEYPECNVLCADDIETAIDTETTGDVAAVLLEPILGAGGVVVPPKEYLPRVRKICDKRGILLLVDEIQTGFGRSGRMFAVEHSNVQPDVMILGKCLGGGLPLAAAVTRKEIAERFHPHIIPTFGGNAVSCAAGLATIRILEEEKLPENAAKIGQYLEQGLTGLAETHKLIGDIRVKGLMCGVELVRDKAKKEPATEETSEIYKRLKEQGVLIGTAGLFSNVLRIQPPLMITTEQIDHVLTRLDEALAEASSYQ
jgi:4-aminobutyrate aminotransferase